MLWLLRHAEAEDGTRDDERPLTELGARQAKAAGQALRHLTVRLDACLSSPKLRALQTAELVCEPLGISVTATETLGGTPFDVRELTAGFEDVLLVGHDPSFSMLLHDLTGAQARLSKGGVAAIEKGELLVLMRPSELEAVAGASGDADRAEGDGAMTSAQDLS